jgi:beta-xylosidase
MKKTVVLLWLATGLVAKAQKPILPDFYADPAVHYWKGKVWIYPTHDVPGSNTWGNLFEWHSFSSKDLVHWTDHGVMFDLNDITWANKKAYAADCIRYRKKYYFYFTANYQIGVAVGSQPAGPFKDALGKPLIAEGEGGAKAMDPCIFIDDGGQRYLYYGQNTLCVVKLKKDMISKEGPIQQLQVPNYHEGIWVHKKDGLYYLSYPSEKGDKVANLLEYSVGRSPLGPFEYKGVIMDNRSRNVHHSIVKIKDKWYLFYHVEGPSPYERRVCVEYLEYNADGTIRPVSMTAAGAAPIR